MKAGGKADFGVDAATNEASTRLQDPDHRRNDLYVGFGHCRCRNGPWLALPKVGMYRRRALFASLGFGLATPAWGWATAFFGHALAGSCLLLGFTLAVAILEASLSPRCEFLAWILVGALLGYSVVVEYPSAIAAAIIGLMIAWKAAAAGRRRFLRTFLAGVLGALPCAVLLLTYHYIVFGSCIDFGYKHQAGFPEMQSGLVGLTYPKLQALYGILASPQHGILWISPLMALVPFAFFVSRQFRSARLYMFCALLVVAYFWPSTPPS